MNRKFIGASLVMLVLITSCSPKDFDPSDNNRSGGELMADPSFAWSTTRKISIEIKGLQLPISISRKLTLSSEEGTVFYAGTQLMNEDFYYTVELPNHIRSISMKYGAIQKSINLSGSKVSFDYLTRGRDSGYID